MPPPAASIDPRDGGVELRVELSAFYQHALSSTEVDILALQFVELRTFVPLGKPEEQAFDPYVVTGKNQGAQLPWAT